MKPWHLAIMIGLLSASLYLKYRAETANSRRNRVRDELASDALSMAGEIVG